VERKKPEHTATISAMAAAKIPTGVPTPPSEGLAVYCASDDSIDMDNSQVLNDYPTLEGGMLSWAPLEPSGEKSPTAAGESKVGASAKDIRQTMSPTQALAGSQSRDMMVSGPTAAAVRERLNSTRDVSEPSSKLICVIDPAGVWAPLLINTVSQAAGQPVQQWAVREAQTLRAQASVQEASAVVANADRVKVSYVQTSTTEAASFDLQAALIERSHLTTVIIDPQQPCEVDALLTALMAASSRSTWRCQALLFMLPPHATWIRTRIMGMAWRQPLQVLIDQTPVTSPSAAWGAILAQWRVAQAQQYRIYDPLGVPRGELAPGKFSLHLPAAEPPPRMIVTAELASSARRAKTSLIQSIHLAIKG